MVDPESISIAIVSHDVPGRAIESIEMFIFEVFEIDTDGILELIVCHVAVCILSESIQNVLWDQEVVLLDQRGQQVQVW